MQKVSQKMAVRNAIFSVLEERGVKYELGGSERILDVLNADDKAKCREILFSNFKSGEVVYKESFQAKVNDDAELKKYVSGLLNNWVRKDKDFNCGEIHKPKNPGSRAGSQDSKIKEMRKLLKITTDPAAQEAIKSAIKARLAEIKPEKSVTIDASALPEELRSLVPGFATAPATEEVES